MPPRLDRFFVLGAAAGALSAAATFIPLGTIAAPVVFGHCFGLSMTSACKGVGASLYLFPGLVFGGLFAGMLRRQGRIATDRGILFVLASGIANAIAVFVCLALIDPLGDRIVSVDFGIAISGAVGGAVGGSLLAWVARRLFAGAAALRPIAVAAGLGAVVVALVELQWPGIFLFYIVWQAGYAASLAASLPAKA